MTARSSSRALGSIALLCLLAAPAASTSAHPLPEPTDQPILVIGASLADGRLPFNDQGLAAFGGVAVNFGSYLSVGDALIRQGQFVVNEAQAGATTFSRSFCGPESCAPFGWQGYDVQLQKAAARVAIPNPADPSQVVGYNAKYVYISMPNDCLHSWAAGTPQLQTAPCSETEVDELIDRMIDVGEDAMDLGLVPIYEKYPAYEKIDWSLQPPGMMLWHADETQWNTIATTFETRITDELPGALLVNTWKKFEPGPDGLHPTPQSANKAAKKLRKAIEAYEEACL